MRDAMQDRSHGCVLGIVWLVVAIGVLVLSSEASASHAYHDGDRDSVRPKRSRIVLIERPAALYRSSVRASMILWWADIGSESVRIQEIEDTLLLDDFADHLSRRSYEGNSRDCVDCRCVIVRERGSGQADTIGIGPGSTWYVNGRFVDVHTWEYFSLMSFLPSWFIDAFTGYGGSTGRKKRL